MIVRTNGVWPITVYGERVLPAVLGRCGACGAGHVTGARALAECPQTEIDIILLASAVVDIPDRECSPTFFQSLLGCCENLPELEARIRYVGSAVNNYHTAADGPAEEELSITEERLDHLIAWDIAQTDVAFNEDGAAIVP